MDCPQWSRSGTGCGHVCHPIPEAQACTHHVRRTPPLSCCPAPGWAVRSIAGHHCSSCREGGSPQTCPWMTHFHCFQIARPPGNSHSRDLRKAKKLLFKDVLPALCLQEAWGVWAASLNRPRASESPKGFFLFFFFKYHFLSPLLSYLTPLLI